MQAFLVIVALLLTVNIVVAGLRILRGPTTRDRLTSVLLLSTSGTGVLLLLAAALDVPALRDAALTLVALATLVAVVRVVGERERAA